MRIISWNVNGLRACARKGFAAWLQGCGAQIVGLQEVRATPEQLDPALVSLAGWTTSFFPAQRLGYSGVALYSRIAPDEVETSIGDPLIDSEGRIQFARFGRLLLANIYFPNGSGRSRDNSRVPYKLDFYQRVFDRLEAYDRQGMRVLVMGDFNTAHREIDLARPRQNRKTSGFLPEERAELDRWLAADWRDIFRERHPEEAGHYTWWSHRQQARERNVGWRIDYVLSAAAAAPFVRDAFIESAAKGSDHCPIGVELDPNII